MTEDHAASCKFCKMPVLLKIDPDALGMFSMDVWVAMAACNRCADYHTARLAVSRYTYDIAMKHLRSEQSGDDEVKDKCRRRLVDTTRKLATLAAKHYRVGFTWEEDWVKQLTENPQNAFKVCSWYESQMRKAPSYHSAPPQSPP